MNETKISIEEFLPEADERFVQGALRGYNNACVGPSGYRKLAALSRSNGEIVGGLLGYTSRNWLFIETLWVAEPFRRRGIGRSLMLAAEQEASNRVCLHAHCDTYDFQALPFYQKLGYQIFGKLDDYPAGHCRYFLQKRNLRESAGV